MHVSLSIRFRRVVRLTFLFWLGLQFAAPAQRRLLHCGQLLDGLTDRARAEMTVVVEGNRIADVVRGYATPAAGDTVIDLKAYTVLPGLMDMHVHLDHETSKNAYLERYTLNPQEQSFRAAVYAERTLLAGFTTVRDLGGNLVNIALRNAIQQGYAVGPRVYTAGRSIAITGGHADPTNGARWGLMDTPGPDLGVADGPEAGRQAVRQAVKYGADVIKITATGGVLSVARDGSSPQFTEAEIEAIVSTARDFGLRVAAHAHGTEGIKRAIRGGVASIEHGTYLDDEGIALMKKNGTYYVPTITAGKAVGDSARVPNYYPSLIIPKAIAIGPKIQATFAKAYKAGVPIAFGTDAGVFAHGQNYLEFTYMVEAGMPPREAIRSATVAAADLLGLSQELGTLEKGKLADVIAVAGDPLANIGVLAEIAFVMKDGLIYKQDGQPTRTDFARRVPR